jgi:hypothetical protein
MNWKNWMIRAIRQNSRGRRTGVWPFIDRFKNRLFNFIARIIQDKKRRKISSGNLFAGLYQRKNYSPDCRIYLGFHNRLESGSFRASQEKTPQYMSLDFLKRKARSKSPIHKIQNPETETDTGKSY